MGKANKKKIDCPATGTVIRPAECGENRMSTYACPAECPKNPWSPENYDQLRKIDHKTREKTLQRYDREEMTRYGHVHTPPDKTTPFAATLFFLKRLYREKDSNGMTFADRWRAEELDGLNNDQKLMLAEEENTVVALLEVQQVIDDRRVMVIDLLAENPEPILLMDCAFAASACRFSTILTLIARSPFFYRLHTAGVPFPEITGFSPLKIITAIAHHLKGPKKQELLRPWLFENLPTVVESFSAIQIARQAESFRNMDAAYSKTEYKICGSREETIRLLDGVEDIHREDPPEESANEGFVDEWVWTEPSKLFGVGRTVLGRILLHQEDRIRLETTTAKNRDIIRPRLEKLLDGQVKFTKQRTDDLSKQMLNRQTLKYDKSLVPKKLLKNPPKLENSCTCLPPDHEDLSPAEMKERMLAEFDRAFLDAPIPALKNKTPRKAATLPALRPVLIQLMKQHVRNRDEQNLQNGTQIDINKTIRELGLDELDVPPPPQRPVPEEYRDEEFEDADDEFVDDDAGCLTKKEVKKRWKELEAYAPLPEKLEEKGPIIVDMLNVFFEDGRLPKILYTPILELTAKITFTIVHPNIPFIDLSEYNVLEAVKTVVQEENSSTESSPFISEEPELLSRVLDEMDRIFPKDIPRASITIFLMALIDTLHHWIIDVMSGLIDDLPSDFFDEE